MMTGDLAPYKRLRTWKLLRGSANERTGFSGDAAGVILPSPANFKLERNFNVWTMKVTDDAGRARLRKKWDALIQEFGPYKFRKDKSVRK